MNRHVRIVALLTLATAAPLAAQDLKAKGEALFTEQKCSLCHSIAGKGNAKGALDEVGSKLSAADLKAWIDQQIAGILAPINNAASAVKGFFGLGGSDAAPPQARAAGGPVSAGKPYLVGERGPDLFGGAIGVGGDLTEQQWELVSALDDGDLLGVDGPLRRTNTGEISIFVRELTVLCKSLSQPPEKFHGLKDEEILVRQRYLDLIYTPGVLQRMLQRSRIIDSVRQTLRGNGFNEVETPVLHSVAGGAAARPFITHHNALDMPLYLRIALELHLKRLLVGGIERVYEIGRVFRNEGVDATHNPEFTMIEIYQAYGDYRSMMDLTEQIVTDACRQVCGSTIIPWGSEGDQIDLTPPWPRRRYADLFREHAGCEMSDSAAVAAKAASLGIDTVGVHPDVVINDVFERTVEDHLSGPVFVMDYPASICPLTKRSQTNPEIAERFELYIRGMELANAYTELNDPILQEQLFRTQLAGQSEEDSMARMDHDFVRALKVGMPPAGGLGIGIDRLVMLLTNSHTIKDVIYFPLTRHEQPQAERTGD